MSQFTPIDLSRLPAAPYVEAIDYEAILARIRADAIVREPRLAAVLEVEGQVITALFQAVAYEITNIYARMNDQVRGVMLAHSFGPMLEHLAALVGIRRFEVAPGDPLAVPPVPPAFEDDEALRRRIQLAFEAFSVAGPPGAYIAHALNSDPLVKDAAVASPTPGDVVLTILSRLGDGRPAGTLIPTVETALDPLVPFTDRLTVSPADIVSYAIHAVLEVPTGPTAAPTLEAARAAAAAYANAQHGLGRDVARSAVFAALHQEGVLRVRLEEPATDIFVPADAAPFCSGVHLIVERVDA